MSYTEKNVQTLDVAAIIKAKAGAKANKIPAWGYRLIEKFIHQDFINSYLEEGREGVDFCQGALDRLRVKITVKGIENIPESGRFTFVSNHPLGAVDGVTMGAILGEKYNGNSKFLANSLLMNIKAIAPLFIPVNKLGGQARDLSRLIDEAFAGSDQMIMFPAGLCSRKIDGKIQDIPWGKAFINKSVEHGRDIIPVHFIGVNSRRFYRIARFCKFFKIKFNLAMLTLPDEMYRSQGREYTVIFGKPIPFTSFDNSRTPLEWAQYVRAKVYEIE